MSQVATPLFVTQLQDSTTLSIGPSTLRIGEWSCELARIQSALAGPAQAGSSSAGSTPNYIVIAATGAAPLWLPLAHPADAVLALEALYRLEPRLRPQGFVPPRDVPADWPPARAATISAQRPERRCYVSPQPQGIVRAVGIIFGLFTLHWKTWLLLGFLVGFLPSVVGELLQDASNAYFASAASVGASGDTASPPPSSPLGQVLGTENVALGASVAVAFLILGLLLNAWMIGALAAAARDAIFGRDISLGGSIWQGLCRLLPISGALLVLDVISTIIVLPILLGMLAFMAWMYQLANGQAVPTDQYPVMGVVTSGPLTVPWTWLALVLCSAVGAYVYIRLDFAPYVAALGAGNATGKDRRSIAGSWRLTRGHWWRVVLVLFGIGLFQKALSLPLGWLDVADSALSHLITTSLVNALVGAPLGALALTYLLYELRVRADGYDAVIGEREDIVT